MFGIGPMLPVIPAAENIERSSRKVRKRKNKHDPDTRSHELTIMRRPSATTTESTLIESSEECSVKEPGNVARHQRDLSLIVDFDLERAAKQLKDGDISDLDLALFAFWVKAKNENYMMAKKLVRELALDQGYNVDKISNLRVRKLLQEIHDIRPRDPRHASTCESPFHSQTRTVGVKTSGSTRIVTSPLTARMDTLPPSLRFKRELAVQEAARPTMASNETADYPPNTPDRPAPLSVKSRSSQASNSTPMPKNLLRSVSTPIRTQSKEGLVPLLQNTSSVVARDTETLSLLSSSITGASYRNTCDVFDAVQGKPQDLSNPFTDELNSSGDRRHGTPGRYLHNEANGHHPLGPYQLDASDIASESSYGTFSSFLRRSKNRADEDAPYDGGVIGDDSFDALESYIGTEDEDECSLLESASTTSDQEGQTQYRFAVQAPASQPVIAGPVPTPSERHATAKAHREVQVPNLTSSAVNFHRPLPLRSYESEASMFPTAGAQASFGRNRARSATSIVHSTRPAIETMRHPPLPASSQPYSSADHIKQENFKKNNSHTKVSEQVDQSVGSVSQRSSNASTLAAFPIPPMGNPVGELPMLISRAVPPHQVLHQTHSQHPMLATALEDTYRAITKVNMAAVLQRTRARGEQLQVVDWEKLTSFERAWREVNEILLVTIYGRKDVFLEETDVAYIDCVARELRNDSNDFASMDWVRHIFEDGV